MEKQRQFLTKTLSESLLAQLDSYLKVKQDHLLQYFNVKHNRLLNELKTNKTKGKHSVRADDRSG